MGLFALIIPALKFLGTAMAVKTAYDGIKEGNILKAVMGGVGAYAGGSSLLGSAGQGLTSSVEQTGLLNVSDPTNLESVATTATQDVAKGINFDNGQTAFSLPEAQGLLETPTSGLSQAMPFERAADTGLIGQGRVGSMLTEAGDDVSSAITSAGDDVRDLLAGDNGLLNAFKDNQQLIGSGMQLYAGDRNRDFIKKQQEENRRREDELNRYRGQTPTFAYNYGN